MSAFFTDIFRQALFSNGNLMENANVRMVLFRSAPSLDTIDASWTAAKTKAELTALTGWQEVAGIPGYPITTTLTVATRAVAIPDTNPVRNNRYVIFTEYGFDDLDEPAPAAAIGLEYIGSLPAPAKALQFPGTAGNYVSTADKAALDLTGDLCIVWRGSLPNWDLAGEKHLVTKGYGLTVNYGLRIGGSAMVFQWGDGTNHDDGSPAGITSAADFIDNRPMTLAATLDVNDGTGKRVVKYWKRVNDTDPWTLVNTQTLTGAATLAANANALVLGARGDGAIGTAQTVEYARVYNGIGDGSAPALGALVASADFRSGVVPYTDAQNNVWGMTGSAWSWANTTMPISNPLIMVSNTPTGSGVNLFPDDALTANPDTTLGAQSNRWLLAWAEPAAGETIVNPIEGPLSIFKGAPDFEASNTVHLWLYPSRANMIANPSFEAIGTDYWACNGTITRTAAPAPGGGAYCGQFVAPATPLIIESNVWSTRLGNVGSEYWTIQLMAAGIGRVKVGLVSWDADYRVTACDWGDGEEWEMVPNHWIHIATVRRAPDAATAMLRIEGADFATLFIDRVLAERGALKEWPYFDGDSTFALQDSYTWYGGYERRGASYSMWYDMRRAVMGRLFATPVDTTYPGDVLSDAEVAEAGMVYKWVPAGVTVVPHIDVFYPGDVRPPPPPKSAAIQPYYDPNTQRMGVVNPWV